MATLYVRGMPDKLYQQLRKRAEAEGRSVSQETVRLLRLALLSTSAKQDQVFAAWLRRVSRQRSRWAASGRTFPDSTALIRADRDR